MSLTVASGSEASLPELPLAPPTAWFRLTPENHNGVDAFTFRLHFSEDIATGREDLRDHSLEVTGGSVTSVERVNGLNRLWEITVAPDPSGDVTIALPAGVACEVAGAICTADGRELHNRPEFTVAGPEPLSEQPPADELTAVWSATMTVEWVHWGYGYYATNSKQAGSLYPALFPVDGTIYTVTMIETAGWMYIGIDRELPFGFVLELDGARFASADASYQSYSYGHIYQWRRRDLSWSTGDTVKIRMLGAVDETTAGRAVGAPIITGNAQVGRTLTVDTSAIADPNGLSNVQYEYQWLADDSDISGATNATYTLSNSDEGKTIKVEVSFTDDAGHDETLTSAATEAVAAAEPSEPPDKPTGLDAAASHGQVVLTWNDPEDDSITGYVILRRIRVNDQGGDFNVLVANTKTAATTYTDDTVAASTTYTYRIKAINGAGTSERSRWVHIDTPAPPVPDQPTGLEAAATHDAVTLTWDDPGDDSIKGYVILRRLPGFDPEGQFDELVANTGTAATTYTDDTVSPETRYTYRIKAINEYGASERSRWAHIDTPAAPDP